MEATMDGSLDGSRLESRCSTKTNKFPWAMGMAKFEILAYRRDTARDRMICDSVFLDQYKQAWADIAPRIGHEMEALRQCVGELAGRPRTIIKLRYAEGETSETIADNLNITADGHGSARGGRFSSQHSHRRSRRLGDGLWNRN